MRGATQPAIWCHGPYHISIHAPHAGSDANDNIIQAGTYDFNPRSPCGERPTSNYKRLATGRFQSTLPMRGATSNPRFDWHAWVFQSTLPMRGATPGYRRQTRPGCDFNPRSPCGERHGNDVLLTVRDISIHAPHAGSDQGHTDLVGWVIVFQSTLPMRGATTNKVKGTLTPEISIHAPHAGSDL